MLLEVFRNQDGGALVAQSVKRQTPGFGSSHDLTVCGFKPHVGLHDGSTELAWDSLSLPLPCSCSLFLKINKYTLKTLKKSKIEQWKAQFYLVYLVFISLTIWGS